jgi:ribose-phosphate pyrophosphokinase
MLNLQLIGYRSDGFKSHDLNFSSFLFPGGEVGVKINENKGNLDCFTHFGLIASPKNSNDLFGIALLKNALSNISTLPITLFLTYLPYARQDRICDIGEPLSVQVIAKFINSLEFKSVVLFDPHSDVAGALFNNCTILDSKYIIHKNNIFIKELLRGNVVLVSPDAGANKKTFALAKYLNHTSFVRADKNRNTATGEITETIVYESDFNRKTVICCDDIIDGGRTFIELAKACKAKNCGQFILYATHGIFSKGIDPLLTGGIDMIYTTDSFCHKLTHEKLNVFETRKIINEFFYKY